MNENAQPQRGGVGHFVPLVRPKFWQWMPVATSFRVDVVLGLLSRGHGMKVRLRDLTLNVLQFCCCLVRVYMFCVFVQCFPLEHALSPNFFRV